MHWHPYIEAGCAVAFAAWLVWYIRGRMASALAAREGLPAILRPSGGWRLRFCVLVAALAHAFVISPSLFQLHGCQHERPLGLPGGAGDSIAKGTPDGLPNSAARGATSAAPVRARMRTVELPPDLATATAPRPSRQQYLRRLSRDGLLAILNRDDGGQVRVDRTREDESTLDSVPATSAAGAPGAAGPVGLPGGSGAGPTAAGSPFGGRVGARLWLYRVRYNCDGWNANPEALPVLLREVQLALHVPVADRQETISLDDLPRHRGATMPTMLFMTGTGRIETSDADRANLRSYLQGGGLLVADSSGGDFEQHFLEFIAAVLPGASSRPIEFDHEVFRGERMPYKLPEGCPIYRAHGSREARGVFAADGRLVVFLSPGDLGDAWAVVTLGRKRDTVELAFQMGTNLVAYGLLTVHDTRPEK